MFWCVVCCGVTEGVPKAPCGLGGHCRGETVAGEDGGKLGREDGSWERERESVRSEGIVWCGVVWCECCVWWTVCNGGGVCMHAACVE